ncbi:MAG TPA: hypothetical protein VFZ65_20675 [Planctomycetota bacterium]|nr:hypothetical protein [Planctomycetota bacterium]
MLRGSSLLFPTIMLSVACSGGGGGGGPIVDPGPVLPAPVQVPAGSGGLRITMAGTWEIRNTMLVDTNNSTPVLPIDGTRIVIDSTGITSIRGFSVDRTELETILGFPFDWYVNQVDGKTMLYGLGYDRRAQGGAREQVGLAGGTIDDNTIVVDSFSSTQASGQDEVFQRASYTLARVAISAAPQVQSPDASPTGPTPTLRQALRGAFGLH